MRILIVGGGGIGTVLAAHLSHAGADVTLFVKERQAVTFERMSVRISGAAELTAPVSLAWTPAGLGPFDYLIVCVKGRDAEAAVGQLSGLRVGAVLSVQNGVLKDEILARFFGRERVLGAVSAVAGTLVRPGVAISPFAGSTLVGELDGSASERGERLAEALRRGGLPAKCVPDIVAREWNKLTAFLRTALVCAITRRDIASAALDPNLAPLCARVALETARVAAAQGHPIWRFPPSLAGLGTAEPVAGASDGASEGEREWRERDVLNGLRETGRELNSREAVVYPSLAQDVMAGRPTELEFTAGDVLSRARRHGRIARVPTLETCTLLLRGLTSA